MRSPFTTRSPARSWRWLLAIYAALGLAYAATSLAGEWHFAAGRWQVENHGEAVFALQRARAIFPFERWFRSGAADYYSETRWRGSRDPAIEAIRTALIDDPFSAGLHRNLAGFLYEDGDEAGAGRELQTVHAISPRSRLNLFVNINPATR